MKPNVLNDPGRLENLYSFELLDTGPEAIFDNIADMACQVFHVPASLITLVDGERVFCKTNVGIERIHNIPHHESICAQAVTLNEPTVIRDISSHPSFINYTKTNYDNGIRFYAGAPLISEDGYHLGMICLLDTKPRTFSKEEKQLLTKFATTVVQSMELRRTLRQNMKRLEDNETQLKQALSLAKVGRWQYDAINQKSQWSDELFPIIGIEKEEGQDLAAIFFSMIHPDDLEMLQAQLFDTSVSLSKKTVRLIRPDGSLLYLEQTCRKHLNEKGELVKVTGISQDITERFAYEDRLQKSKQRFEALVKNGSDIVGVIDGGGNYIYVGENVKQILGWDVSHFMGKNAFDFIHPEDAEDTYKRMSMSGLQKYIDVPPFRFRHADGSWRWIETKIANAMEDPVIHGLIVNSRDVTEWVELQRELKRETEQRQKDITASVIKAQEIERSQLGQELHDNVNQVLTTVKLYNGLIAEGIGNAQELTQKSQKLLQSCIDEIRSISKRLSAPTLGDISLCDSIRELVESINLTNRIDIQYSIADLPAGSIPQDLHLGIYRIIQEQVNNILKYAEATQVQINLELASCGLVLLITDNGKGFDISVKSKGIGIANMKTRAENHNGSFCITSQPGQGCKVRVCFEDLAPK